MEVQAEAPEDPCALTLSIGDTSYRMVRCGKYGWKLSHSGGTYTVTQHGCTCPQGKYAAAPCKHMEALRVFDL